MNNFPISVSQIATGMNEASSALSAAGNSFEESVALLTAGNVTMQNAAKTATALRTISARIRNTTTDLEELGETDFTQAKYDDLIKAVTKYKVSLTDVNGEYRSTYDIMNDIAAQWDTMSSMEQSALATAVAGTRQQSVFFSMMQNWSSAAVKSMDAMAGSSGSLIDAYSLYEGTISAAKQRFKTAFDELQVDAMNAFVPIINGAINVATTLINVVDGLVKINNEFGLLTTAIGAAASFISPWLGVPLIIAGVVSSIKKAKDAIVEAREESIKSAKEYNDDIDKQKTSLDDYIIQIETLKSKIDDEKTSDAELYDARNKLLSIKDELAGIYGAEAEQLDILGMSAEQTTEKLREFYMLQTQDQAILYYAKNKEQIDKAIEEIEKNRIKTSNSISSDALSESQTWELSQITKNLGISTNKISKNNFLSSEDLQFEFTGTSEEILQQVNDFYKSIISLQERWDKEGSHVDLIGMLGLEDIMSEAEAVLNEYSDEYEAGILSQILQSDRYREIYTNIEKAKSAYTKAINADYDSEEEKKAAIKSAYEWWHDIVNEISFSDFGDDQTIKTKLAEMVSEGFTDATSEVRNIMSDSGIKVDAGQITITASDKSVNTDEVDEALNNVLDKYKDESGKYNLNDLIIAGQRVNDIMSMHRLSANQLNGNEYYSYIKEGLSDDEKAYLELAAALETCDKSADDLFATLEGNGEAFDTVSESTTEIADSAETKIESLKNKISDISSGLSSVESVVNAISNEDVISAEDFEALSKIAPEFSDLLVDTKSGYEGVAEVVDTYSSTIDKAINDSNDLIKENNEEIDRLSKSAEDGYEAQIAEIEKTNNALLNQQANLIKTRQAAREYLYTFTENKFNKSKNAYSSIFDAFGSQQYGSTISTEAYSNLIDVFPELADSIETENGLIELNYEASMKLYDAKNMEAIAEIKAAQARERDNYQRITSEINKYDKAVENLTEDQRLQLEALKREQAASENNLTKYQLMRQELVQLSSAYQKWQDAQNMGSSGDMRDDMQKAIDQINEAMKSGQTGVGNYVYQAALDLIVPEDIQGDVSAVQDYVNKLGRYITENPGEGANNFWSDIITAGLAKETSPGSGIYELVEGANVYKIGQVLGQNLMNGATITPDMVKSMFGALELYPGFNFDWTQADWDIAEAQYMLDQASSELDGIKVKFDAGEITQEQYDEVLAKYEELRSLVEQATSGDIDTSGFSTAMTELDNAAKSVGIDNLSVGLNQQQEATTRSQLEGIADNLDTIAQKADGLLSKRIGTLGASYTNAAIDTVISKLNSLNSIQIQDKYFNIRYGLSGIGSSVANTLSGALSGRGYWQGTSAANGGAAGGETLVGELGQELVVSGDRFRTVGDHGAELVNLKRGDIVFNAEDTKKILSGRAGARGIALKDGNAMVSGGGPKIVVYGDIPGSKSGSGSGSSRNSSSAADVSNDEDNWFKWAYDQHKHLVEMDREETKDFLDWLNTAWPQAYSQGLIEYTDALGYEEEVYNGLHDLFEDYLKDKEFQIDKLKEEKAETQDLISVYNELATEVLKELARAKAYGLDETDDYVQSLYQSYYSYLNAIKDLQDDAIDNAKDGIEDLIKYRMKMIKQDLKNEKESLNEQLSDLKDFISKQKEMLQDEADETEYLEKQAELRKTVSDLEIQLNQIQYDNSAWATKRRLELQEELKSARKDLDDFEKDYAFDKTIELLDDSYKASEKIVKTQVESIDDWLENEENVYLQALSDVQNNNQELFEEMRAFERYYGNGEDSSVVTMWEEAYIALKNYVNLYGALYKGIDLVNATGYNGPISGYASGTSNASRGLHKIFEHGDEYIFSSKDGNKYRMFSGGEKVLTAGQTSFLYNFAKSGSAAFTNIFNKLSSGSIPGISRNASNNISMGDIIIQGNADSSTVSEIRRQQRDNINYMLKKLAVLQ